MGYVGKIKDSSGTTHLVASTLFGTCNTAIGTAAKVVTCSNFSQLENGVTIHVYFLNGNTAASPTLNVNSTGAIAVKRYGTTAPQCSTQNWAAGQIVSFTYYEVNSTDKRWVMNDIDQRFDLLKGTGEAAQDKGEGVSPRYFPAKWKFNLGKQPQDGDIITIRIPCAGHTNGVYISLDNGTNYKPVSVNGTSRLTTHYANGKTITLVYESAGQTNDMYNINGGDARENITGGCWTVLNYYDANSDTKVRQTLTNTSANRPILLAYSANTTTTGNVDNICYRDNDFYYNPSTNLLTVPNLSVTNINGVAVGSSPSFTDEKVLQQNSTSGKYRPLLMGYDEINSPNDYSTTSVTNKTFKSQNLLFTPATGTLTTTNLSVTKINGVTVGDSPKFTDNDTTYTFTDGTNGFTVTPSGGTAQTVTVTPSIANNITGSGTSGYLAKFNGTNTITSGPQLGSSTTTYLRNDGSWETPPDTDRYVNSATFTDDTTSNSSNPVKMTLTRAGSDTATVTANIPKVSSSTAGVVPKGATVSTQSQSTKFLREDGSWAAPSYTTNTNTWRNIQVNGTQKLGTGTGTGALNFKDGTNTTVTYDSGIKINATDTKVTQTLNNTQGSYYPLLFSKKTIDDDAETTDTVYRSSNIFINPNGYLYTKNLQIGGGADNGTLTLYSYLNGSSVSGQLTQPYNVTGGTITHSLPLIGGDLFGSGNLTVGGGIKLEESAGIYTISAKDKAYLYRTYTNFLSDTQDIAIANSAYLRIYYKDSNDCNYNCITLNVDTDLIPKTGLSSSEYTNGKVFTLSGVGDLNKTYLRTATFHFACKLDSGLNFVWKLVFDSSFIWNPSAATGSSITWTSTKQTSYSNSYIKIVKIEAYLEDN